jgi:hypothetical protein
MAANMPSAVKRDRQHDQVRGEPRRDQRQPATGIEQHHRVAVAPAVGKPTGRQREYAEGDEGGGAKRDQLGVALAVDRSEREHHGREDQHHEVVERVRPIDEADGYLRLACVGGRRL